MNRRAGSPVWAYVKPLRPVRGPAFITKTNITSRASVPLRSGSPDPRHLHNQQFQPSRADSSREKGGCACWGALCPSPMLASGLAGPPPRKGCSLTGVIVRSSLSCWLPNPHPRPPRPAPTQASAAKQTRSASTAPATPPRRWQPRKVPLCAALPSSLPGTDARPSLARSQKASPRGASLIPEKALPQEDPTQGWRASQKWQKRFA